MIAVDNTIHTPHRYRRLFFWLLLAVAIALRLYRLNAYSLWLDECWQYGFSDHPLDRIRSDPNFAIDQMFLSLLVTKVHILLHLDHDVWQLRLSPVVFGVASVAMIFLLVRELINERAAWIAMILATVWPRLIQYSQEMRAYSLFVLLATTASLALVRALRTNRIRYWVLFGASVVLELYNHYMAATHAVSLGAFALGWFLLTLMAGVRAHGSLSVSVRQLYPRIGGAFLTLAASFLAFLPALPFYLRFRRFTANQPYGGGEALVLSSETMRQMFGGNIGLGTDATFVLLGVLAIVGVGYTLFRFPRAAALGLLWIGTPLTLAMTRGGGDNLVIRTRYLQFVTPAYLTFISAGILAVAAAVGFVSRRASKGGVTRGFEFGVAATLTVAIVVLTAPKLAALYSHDPKEKPVDLRSAYSYVLARCKPGDVVIGFGEPSFWHAGWFRTTDLYYLRNRVRGFAETITIGSKNLAEIPFEQIDRAKGRMFCMIASPTVTQAAIHRIANSEFQVRCWENICVIAAASDVRPSEALDSICAHFEIVDSGLIAVRQSHDEERRLANSPAQAASASGTFDPVAADASIEWINGMVVPPDTASVSVDPADGLSLIGWAWWERTLASGVEVAIDSDIFVAAYGQPRPDVGAYFKNSALNDSGFTFHAPAGSVEPGGHVIRLRVASPDRRRFRLSRAYSVTVRAK